MTCTIYILAPIHGKGDKERIVSISDNTVAHIKRYMRYYHEESILTMDYLFYTIIHGQPHQMSPSNVERIINKYADMIRNKHPDLPQKVHPHMFRRTRATDLYQSTVDLELVSRILGHSSTQTTRIYARPSLEMIRTAMDNSTTTVEVEEAMWPDNEDELARLFGLR